MDYKTVVVYWKEFEIPRALERSIVIDIDTELITTITGPRRAGKSYCCYHLISHLKESGINPNNIIFINFEDERLTNCTAEDLDKLVSMHMELYEIDKKQPLFLFLDEIHNVTGWENWARRVNETKKNYRLVLTGSSSKHLSSEIATSLRGRSLNHEVFPLSFKEALQWKGLGYDIKTILHSELRTDILRVFDTYLEDGGYPKMVLGNQNMDRLLQTYYEVMILRDIVERYDVRNVKQLKVAANIFADSVSGEFSYNRMKNKMNSIGFDISTSTVIDYVGYFENAYLFFQHLKYEYSTSKQLGSIKKLYCVDNGLLNRISFRFKKDFGPLLENIVFVELKRRRLDMYYHKDASSECDFIIKQDLKNVAAVQVTWQLDENTEKREITGLLRAMESHRVERGYILTRDQYRIIEMEGKKIEVLPVWYFLISSDLWRRKTK